MSEAEATEKPGEITDLGELFKALGIMPPAMPEPLVNLLDYLMIRFPECRQADRWLMSVTLITDFDGKVTEKIHAEVKLTDELAHWIDVALEIHPPRGATKPTQEEYSLDVRALRMPSQLCLEREELWNEEDLNGWLSLLTNPSLGHPA
jgi:hypothetical protein